MSYCVHCGVELAPSEEKCPLCKTPVMDPNQAWREPEERPYPERWRSCRRTSTAVRRATGLHVPDDPMLAVLISDLAMNLRMTWSMYVLGAGACIYCWVLLLCP